MSAAIFAVVLAVTATQGTAACAGAPAEPLIRQLTQALTQAPEVMSAQAELQAAMADVDSADYARYPRFELGASGSNGESPSSGNPAPSVDRRLTASLRWTLWDFGKLDARQRAAEYGRLAAVARVDQAREQFLRDLLIAYEEVSRYAMLVDVGRNSRHAMQELERLENQRVQLGGAGITDARLAASRLAQSANKSLQFEQGLNEARLKLSSLLGAPLSQVELPPLRVPEPWLSIPPDAIERIVDESASLRAQRLNLDQARADIEVEESGQLPAIDLTYTRRYEYPGAFAEKSKMGIQITFGTAAALESSTRIQRAASRLLAEEQKLTTMRREALQKAQGGMQRVSLSGQRIQMLSSASADASAVVDARRKLNQAGRGTTLALLDAQVEANNTLIDWVQALHDLRVTEIELAVETGQLLPEPGQEEGWFRSLLSGADWRQQVRQRFAAHQPDPPGHNAGGGQSPMRLQNAQSFQIDLADDARQAPAPSPEEKFAQIRLFQMELKLHPRPEGKWWW
ncbi:MAG: TolC family protein [Burkholderiaceae bacterium]